MAGYNKKEAGYENIFRQLLWRMNEMTGDLEIISRGINCLLEKLGVVETERFIAVINREKFDYTKWQREV